MLKLLILNPHLALFFLSFMFGVLMLVLAPLKYRTRTKNMKIALTPYDLMKYNKKEKNILIYGIVFAALGLIGAAVISEQYGYKTTVTDVKGNVSIEWIGGNKNAHIFRDD